MDLPLLLQYTHVPSRSQANSCLNPFSAFSAHLVEAKKAPKVLLTIAGIVVIKISCRAQISSPLACPRKEQNSWGLVQNDPAPRWASWLTGLAIALPFLDLVGPRNLKSQTRKQPIPEVTREGCHPSSGLLTLKRPLLCRLVGCFYGVLFLFWKATKPASLWPIPELLNRRINSILGLKCWQMFWGMELGDV